MAEHSLVVDSQGRLVSFAEWREHIGKLREEVSRLSVINDEKEAVQYLLPLLENAVNIRIPKQRFGIFFSGGVDSSFIAFVCKKLKADFICYTVGMQGSSDVEASIAAAKAIGVRHTLRILEQREIDTLFKETAAVLWQRPDTVSIGVGAVEQAAIICAKKDGISKFFGGLGSEEIFAGYERHAKADDVQDACWQGLLSMWERDLQRDVAIGSANNVQFFVPFLDTNVIAYAMRISPDLKIFDGHKKYILRKTAERMGLPSFIAMRPKKAAQYGSGFDKEMSKLSKAGGFSGKKEYAQSLNSPQTAPQR